MFGLDSGAAVLMWEKTDLQPSKSVGTSALRQIYRGRLPESSAHIAGVIELHRRDRREVQCKDTRSPFIALEVFGAAPVTVACLRTSIGFLFHHSPIPPGLRGHCVTYSGPSAHGAPHLRGTGGSVESICFRYGHCHEDFSKYNMRGILVKVELRHYVDKIYMDCLGSTFLSVCFVPLQTQKLERLRAS
ncbi:hypothetical protein AKJ16_DCAP16755 [Drosera capensis]